MIKEILKTNILMLRNQRKFNSSKKNELFNLYSRSHLSKLKNTYLLNISMKKKLF